VFLALYSLFLLPGDNIFGVFFFPLSLFPYLEETQKRRSPPLYFAFLFPFGLGFRYWEQRFFGNFSFFLLRLVRTIQISCSSVFPCKRVKLLFAGVLPLPPHSLVPQTLWYGLFNLFPPVFGCWPGFMVGQFLLLSTRGLEWDFFH